jgi:hypothetical protein
VNALELTTGELCERLARQPAAGLDVEAVRRFGERADLVKYAREPVTEEECAAATAWARTLATPTTNPTPNPTPNPNETSASTSNPTPPRRS